VLNEEKGVLRSKKALIVPTLFWQGKPLLWRINRASEAHPIGGFV
jgi:hypothetical protein